MTMITPSYLGETIEYSSLHACRSTLEDPTANAFQAWTPALTKAALNFQLSQNDPGSWAHNFDYTAELLYDSTQDLGGDVSKLRRP